MPGRATTPRPCSQRLDGAARPRCATAPLPLLDPHPTRAAARSRSALPARATTSGSVARGGRADPRPASSRRSCSPARCASTAPAAHDPAALFGALREPFPSCFCFCCRHARGGLPRRQPRAARAPLRARSPRPSRWPARPRRSADPAVDDHLGEQLLRSAKDRDEHEIVVRRIERTLRPHVGLGRGRRPSRSWSRSRNIQHLATPIRAQLAEPRSRGRAGRAAAPDAGGRRRAARAGAARLIAELEGIDRGWYAGPVGWMDAAEDGEFCVALRCALLRDRDGPPATPASGSSPTPTPRPSWPRPRSSSRRCCRCWPAELGQSRAATRGGGLAVELDVAGAVDAEPRPGRGLRPARAPRGPTRSLDAPVRRARRAPRPRSRSSAAAGSRAAPRTRSAVSAARPAAGSRRCRRRRCR